MTRQVVSGAALGLLFGIPWVALSYLGQQVASLPLVPFSLFEYLTRLLPGNLVTIGLEAMIGILHALQLGPLSVLGKAVQAGMAYTMALLVLTLLGVIYAITIGRSTSAWFARGLLAGFTLLVFALPLAVWGGWGSPGMLRGAAWLGLLSLAWGFSLAWGVSRQVVLLERPMDISRSRFLAQMVLGSLAVSAAAILIGRRGLGPIEDEISQEVIFDTLPPLKPSPTPPPVLIGFEPLLGTRPEITPIRDFYRVDINLLPPAQDEFSKALDSVTERLRAQGGETDLPTDSYMLTVDGLVENPLRLSLNDLRALPRVEQYATLTCISNPVGGDLIGTTLFEGARLKDVLDRAGVKPGALEARFVCVDGYTESLPLESANDPHTLLCYAMGNQPLTREHGAPIRLYTPDRFGMKNPKWIIKIEVINEEYFGYWEVRGWDKEAWVKTTSVSDASQTGETDVLQVGGIAFAGARGIQRVEVRLDDGGWAPAEINRPLSPLTWVLWRATLHGTPGRHRVSVRAIDGTGEVQTDVRKGAHPDGATGHHSITVEIKG